MLVERLGCVISAMIQTTSRLLLRSPLASIWYTIAIRLSETIFSDEISKENGSSCRSSIFQAASLSVGEIFSCVLLWRAIINCSWAIAIVKLGDPACLSAFKSQSSNLAAVSLSEPLNYCPSQCFTKLLPITLMLHKLSSLQHLHFRRTLSCIALQFRPQRIIDKTDEIQFRF